MASLLRGQAVQARGQFRLAIGAFAKNRIGLVGFCVLALFAVLALLAPLIVPVDPTDQDLSNTLGPPSLAHPLGTDSFGRDLASRVIYGARLSLLVGLAPVLIALSVGIPFGLVAGYLGGWLDSVAMRIVDGLLSFPALLFAIAIMGVLGPRLQNVILALGVVYTPVFVRLVRSSTLVMKTAEHVVAAQAIGASNLRIAFVHILPNVVAPITVQATATFSIAIIAESTLSFLGLGSQPPTPSWGLMLDEGRRYLEDAPWLALVPGLAITLSVLALNFLGDGLRDALDPQYRS